MTLTAQVERLSIAEHADQEQQFDIVLVDIKKSSKASREIECVKKNLYEPGLKYVAVSYRWGELHEQLAQVGNPLDEDSYVAHITSFELGDLNKLCACIQYEDDLNNMDYLWIDAICIDQVNEEKRKAAIRHMSEIYERASYVLAVPDLHNAYLKQNTANKRVLSIAQEQSSYIYHLLMNNDDNIRTIELTLWIYILCQEKLHPMHYAIFYGHHLRPQLENAIFKVFGKYFEESDYEQLLDGLFLPASTWAISTLPSLTRLNYQTTRVLALIRKYLGALPKYLYLDDHSVSRIERDLEKYFRHLNGYEPEASNGRPCDKIAQQLYGDLAEWTSDDFASSYCNQCKVDTVMSGPACHDVEELWSTHPWKDTWERQSNEIVREMDLMNDMVFEALQFFSYLVNDWSNRTWVISEYLIAKKKANPASLKLMFLSLLPEAEYAQYSPRKYIHMLEKKLDNRDGNNSFYGHLRYVWYGTSHISETTERGHLNSILLSKASKNEDRLYSILPLWGKYRHFKDSIPQWKITDMISVRLKLYELMDREDKINLLYCTRLPSNNRVFGDYTKDSSMPIALPSFATAYFEFPKNDQWFFGATTHQARNILYFEECRLTKDHVFSSNITAIDLETRKEAPDHFLGLPKVVKHRLRLCVKQYMKLKVILDNHTYDKACCQLGLDVESLDAICIGLYAVGNSLEDIDADDIWQTLNRYNRDSFNNNPSDSDDSMISLLLFSDDSLNSDSNDSSNSNGDGPLNSNGNNPCNPEDAWRKLNSDGSLEMNLYGSPLCLIGDEKRNRWIVYCYLAEYIFKRNQEMFGDETNDIFLKLHHGDSYLYIY